MGSRRSLIKVCGSGWFVLLILLFVLSGCTTVKYNAESVETVRVSYPEVGEVVEARVGDELVKKGAIYEVDALVVHGLIDRFSYKIPPGVYPSVGVGGGERFFSANGIVRGALSDPYEALMVRDRNPSEVCVVTVFGNSACYEGDFSVEREISESLDSFQQTLIYNGRVGDKINIGYREFSNSRARPAFNNEVEYDLSESRYIGYRGAELEVIEADNRSIVYRLISNFPDS